MPEITPLALHVDPADDVAVALADLAVGAAVTIGEQHLQLADAVPRGHKFAVHAIGRGESIRKYGFAIGIAKSNIDAGAHVHSHNLDTALAGTLDYTYQPTVAAALPDPEPQRQFQGYRRADGRVGSRNEIWVLCTVGCVTTIARRIAEHARVRFAGRVDGIYAYTHPFGCSQLGDDLLRTERVLAGLARHANAGGVLVVGLGCESLQMQRLLDAIGAHDEQRLRWFNAQQTGDELDAGLAAIEALITVAERDQREPCPLSDLRIGLKCGGSDAFSGLTANPLVGRISDRIAAAGGTPILTEIPEIFGAEHLLMARAQDRQIFDGIVSVVNDFKRYFLDHQQPVHENPSPGNIAGGITTLEEKSLGAVQKGGRSQVTQVLRYGEQARAAGLALLEAPGNDAVSSTALVAAGATVVLFTTGRGTPLGFPAPTLKIASNSLLAQAKPSWIDFDAGTVLEHGDLDAAADQLLDLVLATASGQPARNELNDEREIAIWKSGVTL